jgi:glucosamine--fructose-6-phosphate aminotransferase (isomerizing)
VLISQSGETADTLAALRLAKARGVHTLAIVNVVGSSVAREADDVIYTWAGPEIAVASTKAYIVQCATLRLLSIRLGLVHGKMSEDEARARCAALSQEMPAEISKTLELAPQLNGIARRFKEHEHIFYIGRGVDSHLCTEGSLKLKEISYIHCEAYAAGELKHGTISLIEEGTPVIALSTSDQLFEKTESNIREVKSRGAKIILICKDSADISTLSADEVIKLPSKSFAATLFSSIAAVQILAYESAYLLGCDIDKPRNLAKSVTVE